MATRLRSFGVLVAILLAWRANAAPESHVPYSTVEAVLTRHCVDCHAVSEPEGGLVLETFEGLSKGGQSGPAIVSGNAARSLLIQSVTTGLERDGQRKQMPPGKRAKLSPDEVALLKRWVDQGAPAPSSATPARRREIAVPKVPPTTKPRRGIRAATYSPQLNLVAFGLPQEVHLVSPETRQVSRRLSGIRGSVNALAFSTEGEVLAVAAGEPALFGQATLWDARAGQLLRTIEAHDDALYAIAISPDGKTLATGSYDQKIKLWALPEGRLLHTLSAHNAAIYGLAFRPDGRILASASGDRTIKLWQVATGKRVETLNQPLKEVHAVCWSPDGKRLAAGGADNRIRVWQISESASETTNPLLISKYAHEGVLLNVAWSPDGKTLVSTADDRTLKVWEAPAIIERFVLGQQPDLAPAVAFVSNRAALAIGRLDGSSDFYSIKDGQRLKPAPPGLSRAHPPGVQVGRSSMITLAGTNLGTLETLTSSDPRLRVALLSVSNDNETAFAKIDAGSELPRGFYEIAGTSPGGESGKVRVFVDDVPQWLEVDVTNDLQWPAGVWGALNRPGESDEYLFSAQAGQTITVDLAVRGLGSKLQNAAVTVLNAAGTLLGKDEGYDGGDRFIALKIPETARYKVRVSDLMLGGSKNHSYRLTMGTLSYVTGVFPLDVPTNRETHVELIGYNLPKSAASRVKAGSAGQLDVPLDPKLFRTQRSFQVQTVEWAPHAEQEPNEDPEHATRLSVPGSVNARIQNPEDRDLFQFVARRGETWVLETDGARRGSSIDTRIEILFPDGRPVPRLLLQAVRNTAINFRAVDSTGANLRLDHYEEMELNEFLYMKGDVMRLFRMPQGPDSDMLMYVSGGKRRAWFDTTAVSHALDEQGFIVQPYPLGTKLVPSGLPVFTLNYENDDDGERKMGSDSKLHFTAPEDGTYLVRISDSRGQGGADFVYRLIIRRPEPDFTISLTGMNPTIAPGSGQSFTIQVDRIDGFEGEVRTEIRGLPPGFTTAGPVVIEAGQNEAKGTIFAAMDASPPPSTNAHSALLVSSALIQDHLVKKDGISLGKITLGPAPKLYVALEPFNEKATNHYDPAAAFKEPLELALAPGETIPAWLKVHRNGHKELVTFFAENLPHGVIVADIGLNGVLIPKDESERKIFFTAAKWVADQDRPFFMIEQQAGRQTSRPVLLKVRRPQSLSARH